MPFFPAPSFFLLVPLFLGCRHWLQTGGGTFQARISRTRSSFGALAIWSQPLKPSHCLPTPAWRLSPTGSTGPEDWQWGYESSKDQKKIREHYDNGRSIQIIVWLADYEEESRLLDGEVSPGRMRPVWPGSGRGMVTAPTGFFLGFSPRSETYPNHLTREEILEAFTKRPGRP